MSYVECSTVGMFLENAPVSSTPFRWIFATQFARAYTEEEKNGCEGLSKRINYVKIYTVYTEIKTTLYEKQALGRITAREITFPR